MVCNLCREPLRGRDDSGQKSFWLIVSNYYAAKVATRKLSWHIHPISAPQERTAYLAIVFETQAEMSTTRAAARKIEGKLWHGMNKR